MFQEKKQSEPGHIDSKENRMLQGQIIGDVMEYLILGRHKSLYHLRIIRFVLLLTQGCLTPKIYLTTDI